MNTRCSHGGYWSRQRWVVSSERLGGRWKTIGDDTEWPELVSGAMGLIKALEILFSNG
jgi:hypothetical protein